MVISVSVAGSLLNGGSFPAPSLTRTLGEAFASAAGFLWGVAGWEPVPVPDMFAAARAAWRPDEGFVFLEGESILGADPEASLCVRDGVAWRRERGAAWARVPGDAWELLRDFARGGSPGTRGCAVFLSYDAGRLIETIPDRALDDTGLPQILAHRFGASPTRDELPTRPGSLGTMRSRMSTKDFEAMVLEGKARVRAGEVFQVNLSHRLEATCTAGPLDLYAKLRVANPAPFSGLFNSGPLPDDPEGFQLLSCSPERLFLVDGGRIESRPIAGTRRRGGDPVEDAALVAELRADEKENAEHVMLVDLARNDLGRVARFGSVRVPRLLDVESYRSVHHLVSTVDAELAPGKDAVDAIRALFPGGTITGAPKVRAMEIIEELEPVRRGAYTGSLGWIAPDGSCDLNILIRTLVLRHGNAHLQVGAGIVEDSVPEREHAETLAKAEGLLRALR